MRFLLRVCKTNLFIFSVILTGSINCFSQKSNSYSQTLRGNVIDLDTHQPVEGVHILVKTEQVQKETLTDTNGNFKLIIPMARLSLTTAHLGYQSKTISNIVPGAAKEVVLEIFLEKRVYKTEEVVISSSKYNWLKPNSASSVKSLQSQDAARYAGGYYDPLRMVSNFAGISSGNNDESNEIVVRGNSPRGMLWRLEGMEIPNPNHLTAGTGSNSGAYSIITTNVLADFDFYTGAFPAEYGNALSGVMDLKLRKGNVDHAERGVQLSVVGVEATAEGPVGRKSNSSYLFNVRYANFNFLKKYGIIQLEDMSIVPNSYDWTAKLNFRSSKIGDIVFFTVGGKSVVGDDPTNDPAKIKIGEDVDFFLERNNMAVVGVRNLYSFKNGKSYIRNIVGVTWLKEYSKDGYLDTSKVRQMSSNDLFSTPVARVSTMLSHSFSPGSVIKAGVDFNKIFGDMLSLRRSKNSLNDTLIDRRAKEFYVNGFFQWKLKPESKFEIIPAFHFTYASISKELIFEPRLGILFSPFKNGTFNIAAGVHSRLEPLPIYFFRVKVTGNKREEVNRDLTMTRAIHLVGGYKIILPGDVRLSAEWYFQHLFKIPVSESYTSTYSTVNISQGLPDLNLINRGISDNTGVELTIEKSFSKSYYFLLSASLFDSKYRAPNRGWYSTYYNANFIINSVIGKEFKVGKSKQNSLAVNFRNMARGGYRYTPPDITLSLKKKTVVYDVAQTYGKHLPFFNRLDAGLNYKKNYQKSALIFSLDVQNLFNLKNVYRISFSYKSGSVIESERKGIGLVPIGSIRYDF